MKQSGEILRSIKSLLWTTDGPAKLYINIVDSRIPIIGPTIDDLYTKLSTSISDFNDKFNELIAKINNLQQQIDTLKN